MIASAPLTMLLKVTVILALALLIDQALRRRWVLVTGSMWNAVFAVIIAFPATMLIEPAWAVSVFPMDAVDAGSLRINDIAAKPQPPEKPWTASQNDLAHKKSIEHVQPAEPAIAARASSTHHGLLHSAD